MERYVIHVTKKCNMNCSYCYEKDKSSGDRSWEDTKKILDDIIATKATFEIEFLGGEPLLNFTLIKECVEYLRDRADVRKYYITTNGTILTPEILDFLYENPKIIIGVSIDGNLFMNSLRVFKGSGHNAHHEVMLNLVKLRDILPEGKLLVHIVSHNFNVGFLSDGVDFFYKNGIRVVDVGIVEGTMVLGERFGNAFIREHGIISTRMINNEYPGLIVTTLQYEPRPTNKIYVRDNNGVVVAESYGRSDKKFLEGSEYSVKQSHSPQAFMDSLRETVFDNHARALSKHRINYGLINKF